MKKVINVGIGGRAFVIDEDAYQRLRDYLKAFRKKTQMGHQAEEVMDDLEMRIGEIFSESLGSNQEVVNIALVNKVISQLGMPDGSTDDSFSYSRASEDYFEKPIQKFYRDSDHKALGGVCGGIAIYFDVDIMLVRILFVIALIFGSLGFWIYLIFWIVAPLATTAAQKCEMRGLPITAENMRRFSNYSKQKGYGNNY